ncbi:MAG TPA: hypothetical protein VLJ10_00460 [Candidatus Bathyarchaeia archaeon]|nr:hypothetical protein [Candidatus Bathyarchaeia archaeon]
MLENRIFKYALITSFLVHTFIFLVFWMTEIEYQRTLKPMLAEVVYQAQVKPPLPDEEVQKHIKGLQSQNKIPLPKILTPKEPSSAGKVDKPERNPVKLDLPEKSTSRLKDIGQKRQIKIPMLDSDKMMGPRYMTYHEQVRSKIRNRAYFYVDDPRFAAGEVYLTFVLGSDGSLRDVKLVQEKTRANSYLGSVGLRSIKESSPFPPFPGDLNYPELTFNVVISFEVGD